MAFASGQIRALITKPKIGAWGLNFQNCSHTITFPSHSFEQYYQSVRRFWRFGQKSEVRVDIIASDGEMNILKNLQRKSKQAEVMFDNLIREMGSASKIASFEKYEQNERLPKWLTIKK